MSILASRRHFIHVNSLVCFHSSRTENSICEAPQKLLINFTSWSVNNWNYSAFKLSGENKSLGEIRFDPKSCLVIWCINAYSFVFSAHAAKVAFVEGWNAAGFGLDACQTFLLPENAFNLLWMRWQLSLECKYNTPSTSDLYLGSSFSCRPTVDHRDSVSTTNEFIHAFP